MYYNFGIATEAINQVLSSQEPSEFKSMKEYLAQDIDTAMESIDTRSNKKINGYSSRYLAYLVDKVEVKASNIDWGDLPKTNGDINKWKEAKPISESISLVGSSNIGMNLESYILCKALYDRIVIRRKDFEYGYKTDNALITLTYQSSCYALLDLAIIMMVEYSEQMAHFTNGAPVVKSRLTRQASQLVKSSREMVDVLGSPDWDKIINAYKTSRIENIKRTTTPTKALEGLVEAAAVIGSIIVIAAVAITGAIALVSAIRGLITLYYRSAVNVDTKARSMQEYLDEIMPYEKNKDALKKQKNAYDSLGKLAGFIESKIIKENAIASKEIATEDRAEASPEALERTYSGQDFDNTSNFQFC